MALLQPPPMTSQRITHVAFCLFFLALLLSYDTGLKRAIRVGDVAHVAAFLFAAACGLASFAFASWTEPGFVLQGYRAQMTNRDTPRASEATTPSCSETEASVTEEEVDLRAVSPVPVFADSSTRKGDDKNGDGPENDDDGKDMTSEHHLLGPDGDVRRLCRVCKVFQPLRTKHCISCRRCVRRHDHHCPYLGQCVGERNHRWFFFFVATHAGLCIYTAYQYSGAFSHEEDWNKWLIKNFLLLFGTLLVVVGSFVFSILLACHTYLIVEGQTTWEYLSGPKITYLADDTTNPFDEGVLRNLKWFFLSPSPIRPREWEQVYLAFRRRQALRKSGLREVVVKH